MIKKIVLCLLFFIFSSCGFIFHQFPGSIRTQFDEMKQLTIKTYFDEYWVTNTPNYFFALTKEYVLSEQALSCFVKFSSSELREPVDEVVYFKIDGVVFEVKRKSYLPNLTENIEEKTNIIRDKSDQEITVVTGLTRHESFVHFFEIEFTEEFTSILKQAREVSFQVYANKKPINVRYEHSNIKKLMRLFD